MKYRPPPTLASSAQLPRRSAAAFPPLLPVPRSLSPPSECRGRGWLPPSLPYASAADYRRIVRASVRCPRRCGREGLLEASDRADATASWGLAGLGDCVFSDRRRGSSELRHGERLIPRTNGLAVGHHVAKASDPIRLRFLPVRLSSSC